MLPLDGIRVLDLTGMLAGPYASRLLADMGAEVIKVESLRRYDLTRGPVGGDARGRVYPEGDPGEHPINRSSYYNEMNRNKLGIALDLQAEEGREIFLRLVAASDAVIENFSASVLGKLGLGYEELRRHKPDIVLVSMPAFGKTGPWRDAVAYGNTIEMLSGLAGFNGYPDGLAMPSSFTYGDPVAGVHAAFLLLSALEHRDRTGEGHYIEQSQHETLIQFLGEVVVGYGLSGETPERMGNRSPIHAPHGIYRSAEEDGWIAIAVTTDAEWDGLCGVIGRTDLRDDERYATPLERHAHRDELDAIVSGWTEQRSRSDAAERLQSAGVPAMPVLDSRTLAVDPQFAARGYLEEVEHPEAGRYRYPALPWKMSGVDRTIRAAAPRLGEHTRGTLVRLLDLDPGTLQRLEDEGVIGDTASLYPGA